MPTYLVFARDDFEKVLECFGEVDAPDDETARTSALRRHESAGRAPAIEMVLVPAGAAHWVVRSEAAAEGATPATGAPATGTSATGSGKR